MRSALLILFTFLFSASFSQNKPGKIIRAAPTGAVRTALDPNADDFVSATTTGFSGNDDVTTSEIAFKPIVPYSLEPHSDLRRGPSHNFTDFVPGVDNASYYMFYRNNAGSEALMFRMRLGSVVPGAKGYSVLFDTDGKFGASGPNADPNYVAATTGIGGNPGFEVEIVLATGGGSDGVLLYNVDGTDNPGAPTVLSGWTNYSQISLAATNDNGDPDFYLDWYVPQSALTAAGITTTTSFRVVPTTVMAPKGAIGGPKSDIYGLADNNYKDPMAQYEAFINAMPPFKLTDLAGTGTTSPTVTRCTSAPGITSPISAGASVTVSGTWTKSSLTGAASTAYIYLYKNGGSTPVAQTSVAVNSGASWSIGGVASANGDVFMAKAQAPGGESMCLVSNSVTVQSCTPATTSSVSNIAITCSSLRGFDGTAPAGSVVRIYTVTSSGYTLFADETTTTYKVGRPGATTRWIYDGANVNSSDPCTGGATDVPAATYAITIQEAGKCESDYYYVCNGLGATTAAPLVTQTNLYAGNATVSGTATSGATVRVFVNGQLKATVTATGGNYSVSSLPLATGDVVDVYAQASGQCVSVKTSRTATCFTSAPLVTTTVSGQLREAVAITGISYDPAGTVVRIYNSANTLMSTTTVQADGTWSTTNAGTTNSNGFAGTAVGGATYYAQAQSGSCAVSANTANYTTPTGATSISRCGTITSTVPATAPVSFTVSTTSVSGALSGTALANTTVSLYEDGQFLGSLTTGTNTWANLDVTSKFYNGGVLSLGIQEPGKAEVSCPTTYTVTCTPPLTPTATFLTCTNCGSPANPANVKNGGTITYRINNLQGNTFYSIREQGTGKSLATGQWTPAAAPAYLDMTTNPLTTGGSYTVDVVSTAVLSTGVCSAMASQGYMVVLPVTITEFKGRHISNGNELTWKTENESNFRQYDVERSTDGSRFTTLATVSATGAGYYSFTDNNVIATSNYYRLRLVNANGSYSYSNTVLLKQTNSLSVSSVHPNPFVSSISLELTAIANEPVRLVLVDEKGKQVAQKVFVANAGRNVARLTNLEHLSAGIYLLQIITGSDVLQQKLVKLQ